MISWGLTGLPDSGNDILFVSVGHQICSAEIICNILAIWLVMQDGLIGLFHGIEKLDASRSFRIMLHLGGCKEHSVYNVS